MDAETRALVWERAKGRCEYCRLHHDDDDFLQFHVEHILPRKHGGSDNAVNLCLACAECNLAKGTNLAGFLDGKIVPLFNPRRQKWARHFTWNRATLVGRTLCGKVTIHVLNINDPVRMMVRQNLRDEGRFPPQE